MLSARSFATAAAAAQWRASTPPGNAAIACSNSAIPSGPHSAATAPFVAHKMSSARAASFDSPAEEPAGSGAAARCSTAAETTTDARSSPAMACSAAPASRTPSNESCNSTRRADGVPPGATDGVLPGTTGLTRAPSPPDWLSASAAQRRSSVAAVVGVWNRTRAATADSASDDSAAPRSPLRRSQVDLTSGRSERGLCGGASKA
mmetsp:Transcript_45497/g.135697  ORF Transcript_45497/g.135697 Transcript_45497/m.135697 type:complete len:205 (-) Transcript_45497:447-1061(-)